MFNSKKIKKVIQQQELLEAKLNLLTYSQKTLSEDLEVHFKRMRQSIYSSIEDLSSQIQEEMVSIHKQLEQLKKPIDNVAESIEERPTIKDKMKFHLTELIDDIGTLKQEKRTRQARLPIDSRDTFFVSVKLPEGVLNYLHNRSANKSVSTTCRNVFEREGKLVFAPLSYEITKNFTASKLKVVTIQVSKNTYLAMRKIANELEVTTLNVANNFIATLDPTEAMNVGMSYSKINAKDLQYKSKLKK